MINFLRPFIMRTEPLVDRSEPLIDRRSATRLSTQIPIQYRMNESQDWSMAQSIDISADGVRTVFQEDGIHAGSEIEIRLRLPEIPHVFEVKSTVVWVRPKENKELECGLIFEGVRQLSHKEKLVHFFADKICRLVLEVKTDEFETKLASTLDELTKAYQLIYKEYLARGYCSKKSSEMHYNHFCVLPETRTFLLKKKENLIGTISLIPDSPCGLPMESLFPREIEALRNEKRKLAEVSLLSLSKEEFHHKGFSLGNLKKLRASYDLFKIMLHYADTIGVTDLVIAVHPKHEALYQYLLFDIIGPVRSYDGACGNPALPMRMTVKKFIHAIQGTPRGDYYRAFLNSPSSRHIRSHHVWDTQSVQELFKLEPSVMQNISEKAESYIRRHYQFNNCI
jgi:hypothetical protein